MPGEPAWFDVSKLECIEIDEPGVEFPSNIIDWGEDFYLQVTFKGLHSATEWHNMTDGEISYTAKFYGKYMGPQSPGDLDLGTITGKLKSNQLEYTVKSSTKNVQDEGIWRCGVTVTFRLPNGMNYHGVLGYNEDCVIQISMFEEPH